MILGRPPIQPKPFLISDGMLFSSNVSESEESAYSSTADYIIDDRAQIASPSTTVTISNATPAVVTWANHMLPANTPIELTTSGALPAGLTASTVYYVVNAKQNTFNLASKPGGSALSTSDAGSGTHTATATRHDIYQAKIATASVTASISGTTMTVTAVAAGSLAVGHILSGSGVTAGTYITALGTGTGADGTYTVSVSQTVGSTTIKGNAPVTNSTYWGRADSTNKFRMFDSSVSSQSSRADSMEVEIRPDKLTDALLLANIDTSSSRVVVKDASDVTHYDKTYSGVETGVGLSFYGWCFEPIIKKKDLYIDDLPNIASPRITITLTNTGVTVFCGSCVPVLTRRIGTTQRGLKTGLIDYSRKEVDEYGNNQLVQGRYSRRVSLTSYIENSALDATLDLLISFRTTAVVYVGINGQASTYIFGWFNDVNTEITYPDQSLISIDLESLT